MNPRAYDLGKQGRSAFNRKLGLNIDENQLTLTPQDLLYATDYLLKVEKGLKKLDDIDHLKNRRVRTSGELIQIQIGIAIVRLEKSIREKLNKTSIEFFVKTNHSTLTSFLTVGTKKGSVGQRQALGSGLASQALEEGLRTPPLLQRDSDGQSSLKKGKENRDREKNYKNKEKIKILTIKNLINNKAFNSALREFFGTSPLSQFMDQINPLAEITHKRRLSSMGPGGVTRDSATLAIRGIHPTHYGRICPVETPEGKNTGLVNSMTTYARVNPLGLLESPFYKVYKGIVLKSAGIFYFSADQEEETKLAAADIFVTPIGFLPNTNVPVRIGENFTKIYRSNVEYIGISALQMISIATSLIPFLEHDDANRALMGSNMQRQAVPLIRPERPIVGTGLESRAVSDSGHILQSKISGVVTYVSAEKIIITTLAGLGVS
jgi:DNA-directed RNA polymerase subunit beta